jgi:hypothetical protein
VLFFLRKRKQPALNYSNFRNLEMCSVGWNYSHAHKTHTAHTHIHTHIAHTYTHSTHTHTAHTHAHTHRDTLPYCKPLILIYEITNVEILSI